MQSGRNSPPHSSAMPDIFTKQKRSEIMSRIRSSGTQIEDRLYAIVRGILGNRWRIDRNVTQLPGQPDLVVPSLKLAIFADGCFYHCCPKHGHIPKSNRAYWQPKLARNRKRDCSNRRKLRAMGYSVWRVWAHGLKGHAAMRTSLILSKRLRKITARKVSQPAH